MGNCVMDRKYTYNIFIIYLGMYTNTFYCCTTFTVTSITSFTNETNMDVQGMYKGCKKGEIGSAYLGEGKQLVIW